MKYPIAVLLFLISQASLAEVGTYSGVITALGLGSGGDGFYVELGENIPETCADRRIVYTDDANGVSTEGVSARWAMALSALVSELPVELEVVDIYGGSCRAVGMEVFKP